MKEEKSEKGEVRAIEGDVEKEQVKGKEKAGRRQTGETR